MTTVTLDELLDGELVDREPDAVDRVRAQVRQVRPGVAVLSFLVSLLMWVGRIPAYVVTAVVWTFVAVREGYREVRPPAAVQRRGPGELAAAGRR